MSRHSVLRARTSLHRGSLLLAASAALFASACDGDVPQEPSRSPGSGGSLTSASTGSSGGRGGEDSASSANTGSESTGSGAGGAGAGAGGAGAGNAGAGTGNAGAGGAGAGGAGVGGAGAGDVGGAGGAGAGGAGSTGAGGSGGCASDDECADDPTGPVCDIATGQCGVCVPGETQACYHGAPGTESVGPCLAGVTQCDGDGLGWGPCEGQVLPVSEVCGNGVDEDCDGVIDTVPDTDGDGFTTCDGDCCEEGSACPYLYPWLVNPGGFEFVGNGVDDDCDPQTSDMVPEALCSDAELLTGVTAEAIARAMDICQDADPNPLPAQKKWGLLSAELRLADGSVPTPAALAEIQSQRSAILTHLGAAGILPEKGLTMAGISTGRMRDEGHPDFVPPSPGLSFGALGQPPADYLAAHGGALPSSSGCSGACPPGAGANDSVSVRLAIRAPMNVSGFEWSYRFFSAEYAGRVCSDYNDFFLARLTSAALGLPPDKNIVFDMMGNPVSVNNVFFEACSPQGCSLCPQGPADLAGTGFEVGGATGWSKVGAPIVRGETFEVDLAIFDVSDGAMDSAALIDAFEWLDCFLDISCHHEPCPDLACPK